MIDLHHHLVHGVDDGAQTFEQTQAMLCVATENGISDMIATSHAAPGQIYFDLPLYWDHLEMAREWCDKNHLAIGLYPGAEIFYTDSTLRMLDERRILTLNQSRYVLLEFAGNISYEKLLHIARQFTQAEYLPIFAHVERYRCLTSPGHLRKLQEKYGVMLQMNANTVLNPGSLWRQLWCRHLLQAGLIDVVASDAHNTGARRCRLKAACEKLAALCGQETAHRLCTENPFQIFQPL